METLSLKEVEKRIGKKNIEEFRKFLRENYCSVRVLDAHCKKIEYFKEDLEQYINSLPIFHSANNIKE